MLHEAAVSFADGERGDHGDLTGRHEPHELLADRTLNDRMGQRVDPRVYGLPGAVLVRNVNGGADAVLVEIRADAPHQFHGQQRNEWSRSPSVFVERQFDHVRFARNMRVEQWNRLGPRLDQCGAAAAAVSAGDRHQRPGSKDAGTRERAVAFPRTQREDEVRVVPPRRRST